MPELDLTLLSVLSGLVFVTMEALKALGYVNPGTSAAAKRILAGVAAAIYTVVHVFVVSGGVEIDSTNWLSIVQSIIAIATSAWGVATLAYHAIRQRIRRVAGESPDSGGDASPPAAA